MILPSLFCFQLRVLSEIGIIPWQRVNWGGLIACGIAAFSMVILSFISGAINIKSSMFSPGIKIFGEEAIIHKYFRVASQILVRITRDCYILGKSDWGIFLLY
jgi:hypothetical protein